LYDADGFHNIGFLFVRTSEIKFMLAFMKSLTNCENLFSNPLQVKLVASKVVPKSRKPPGILKIVPKAGLECRYFGENRPLREKENQNRNLIRLLEPS
jgi:hypothetical protein